MLLDKKLLLSVATLVAQTLGQPQAAAGAGNAVAPDDSHVVKLGGDEFDQFVKENPLFLAEFFAPWCGHCKNLAPEYVEAAETLLDENIPLVQLDCEDNREFCMGLQIPGYPTLKVYKNGSSKDYQGGRTAQSIVSYMRKQSLPTVQVVQEETVLKELVRNATIPVVVDTGAKGVNATFYNVADKLADDCIFVSLDSSAKKTMPEASVLLFAADAQEEAKPFVFDGDLAQVAKNSTLLENWIKQESVPYFGDVNGNTFEMYVESGKPLAYFFYTSEDEREEYAKFFTQLGEKHRGVINFAGLDASKYGKHAENLNMKEQFPLFVVHNVSSNLKYGMPQMDDAKFAELSRPLKLKTKDITNFVDQVLAGKAEPIIKSEPVPETQDSNVHKLVAKTHNEITSDPKKDVFVKYYAPWCGHCKKLAPIFEEMADIYAQDKTAAGNVVVAEVDCTLNDISDVDIVGFPTMILYPAGKNSTPVVYEGSRSLEDMMQFIHENGANDVDGLAISKKIAAESQAEEASESKAAHQSKSTKPAAKSAAADVEHDEL
ncbi:protein disulfide isomerase PDI1 KNAG_0C00380 [Huiozyma naganishii CBS 8797]|uniref:Protein disulfide-isomerase n=1 Tax=Huiozyma naganishii (strain ATCC MYA-139 / BCRC 22969 / CBS 8797 / KCTC 17520 / NBRC 10181 / NCYC 3082 / Yp74L-3) TaxID=1071383 RepID=J7RW07_HUIN7|nr:hypothetical protein KNAG_0C00380 [Kazachstania naganishii CBS 8797]CCK69152.1 hypothetical protein KNAG_0C00380 [Kazachstania naganishii CBS 8797]